METIENIDNNNLETITEEENNETINFPNNDLGFTIDENDEIPDDDIRQMLFLFCVNEKIPIHYKQLLGKIIKKNKYLKSEKLFIFNMIGYIWQKEKNGNEPLTEIQKIIIVRRIHKIVFGKFDDN